MKCYRLEIRTIFFMCGVNQNNKSKIIYSESEIINLYNSNNICLYIYVYCVYIIKRLYCYDSTTYPPKKSSLRVKVDESTCMSNKLRNSL